ncbi:Galactose transporter [Cyphellophora attinorum]|uniref:Galactose transporter n=1 Tax=Cyphellophora attinorum TaxID=1664694 RepID=A0A0N1GY59_9EURO|nr:Galactose transporter [Phialophora attinorum]KPI35550.1 Galactose transporter [Phialophora attinorum]
MVGAVVSANPLQLDVRSHRKCMLICCLITVASFQYGLDYALVGGFMAMPGFLQVFGYYDEIKRTWAIDPTVQQLISSLMTIGTFIGSLAVGPFSARFGRRYGLWAASAVNAVSTAIMLGTTNLGALYFARLILGISVGWFLTFCQVYVNEVAPAHLRGIVFAVYQSQLSIGSIVGASVDYGTHTWTSKAAYRVPLAIFFAAPTIQSIALFFFPESPRWLCTQGREEEAKASLRRLRNKNIKEEEFQAEFNEILISTRSQVEQNKKQLWVEMWKGTDRRRTFLSIAVICFHCANGSSWINIYTTYFLKVAGIGDAFAYSAMVTCMGLLGVFFSFLFVRKIDRRLILLVGVAACGLAQLGFAVAWSAAPATAVAGRACLAFTCIFTFFYVAYAPYAWLMGGEYPNNHLRAHVFGLATALNFLGNWLGVFTAPYFINPASLAGDRNMGKQEALLDYIWFGSNAILFLFTFFYVPETRDRTLEEIHEMFEARVPARKFKGYVCTSTQAMHHGTGKVGEIQELEDVSTAGDTKKAASTAGAV